MEKVPSSSSLSIARFFVGVCRDSSSRLRAGLHCAYKITKVFEGVYTIQNGAYERNGLTAYSLGGHNIVLNWITEITDLLKFFVVSVKFGSYYA